MMVNKFPGTCIRCGARVPAGEGVFQYGTGSKPWPWPAHRFQRNLPITEHARCHERYDGTGTHYQYHPIGSEDDV